MNENLYQLKDTFLKEWSVARIKNLTLEEYTNLDKNSFCYWLEAKTNDLGSIWGGSSYKFGIYKRRNASTTITVDNRITDGEYAWFQKYGTTKEEAFQTVKSSILSIIYNVQNNSLEDIDTLDLGDAYKWKIAFLYGNFNVINIFKNESLYEAAVSLGYTDSNKSYTALNKFLFFKKANNQDYFEFTTELWKMTSLANTTKYWIYAPGESAHKWEEFYNDSIIGLGWDNLGDLNDFATKNEIKTKLQSLSNDDSDKKNDTVANYDFYKTIKIGDVIFAKKGIGELLGYGIVTSDYFYDEGRTDYQKCRKIDWKLKGNWKLDFNVPLKTLTNITKYPSKIKGFQFYYENLFAIMKADLPKDNPKRRNLKLEFLDWMISTNRGNFYANQFSNKKENFLERLNLFETKYKECFQSELFKIDVSNLQSEIDILKTNIYDKSNPFSDFSIATRNGQPSAILGKKNYIYFLENHSMKVNTPEASNVLKFPNNQILFGPPGTGKTYKTKELAVQIANPTFIIDLSKNDDEQRKDIVKEYNRLFELGQINFTTFHQSMSYEDFVEGIKPKIDENENEEKQVIYEVEDGIFKKFAEKALKNSAKIQSDENLYFFEDGWDDLIHDAKKKIEENDPLTLQIQTPNLGMKIIDITNKGNIIVKPTYSENAKEYTISFTRTKKLHGFFPDLSIIKNIDKEFRNVIGGSNSTSYWAVLNYINNLLKNHSKTIVQETVQNQLPYVLIIDEINRGNVSAIFGELITLLEEDKRLGKEEAIQIELPYSKTKFGVPQNLYIIGTMNTADRSVEALDTALRRRFSFVEILPNSTLLTKKIINGINLKTVLETINKRIEILLDRDHTIGHSYFLNVTNESDLKNVFQNNIIPLLQEYFYGDYEKIGLIIGQGFFENEEKIKGNRHFAPFFTKNNSVEKSIFRLKTITAQFDIIEALRILLGDQTEKDDNE